jgi:hypothetical protein
MCKEEINLMYKQKLFLLIVLLMMSSLIVSCNQYTSNGKGGIQSSEKIIKAKGTIEFIELEGGFFGIIADDGSKYKPVNLPDLYKQDGLKVRFEGKFRTDLLGIYMWGKLIEIINIKEL